MLGKTKIKELIKEGLVENMVDANIQIQPNGVDLTVGHILIPLEKCFIDFDNSKRHISRTNVVPPSEDNIYHLTANNIYIIKLREKINLPKNIAALTRPRSSLMRSGIYIESAVWDSGYRGSGQVMLHVVNPHGLDLTTDARICQMVFFNVEGETEGYSGIYQDCEIELV